MAVFQTCFWVGFLGLRIRPALNLPRQNKKHNIPWTPQNELCFFFPCRCVLWHNLLWKNKKTRLSTAIVRKAAFATSSQMSDISYRDPILQPSGKFFWPRPICSANRLGQKKFPLGLQNRPRPGTKSPTFFDGVTKLLFHFLCSSIAACFFTELGRSVKITWGDVKSPL